jgi:cytochrome d ubiquinol oxidase subunit II
MPWNTILQVAWFFLIGIIFTAYTILDGVDFGIGAVHLFSKNDRERRELLNVIGPFWDGNEVWLIVGGGALFAAFPEAYATVFSGFYLAFMLFLFALILRAVSIEFRSKVDRSWWHRLWDSAFCLSSILAAFLLGVALGNIGWGIPLNRSHEYEGSFFSLLHPYSLLVGVTAVAFFMMHGSLYAVLKTEGVLHHRAQTWVKKTLLFFTVCYVLVSVSTVLFVPHMAAPFKQVPLLWALPVLNFYEVLNIFRETRKGLYGQAFFSSCTAVFLMMVIFGLGLFPYLVYSPGMPQFSLSIYNSASSPRTLAMMLAIAAIGLPLVAVYTVVIHRIFSGKVRLDEASY